MTDRDLLLERLGTLDPVDPAELDRATADADATRRRIVQLPVDELSRGRRRRLAAAVAAAIAAAALLIPLVLLLPLSDDRAADRGPGGPGTVTGPSEAPPSSSDVIRVTAPAAGAEVSSPVLVQGDADVFEATVSIRIYDGTNNLIAETFTTATCGSGCRGNFSTEVEFAVGTPQSGVIKVFEASAEDGSPIHVVRIPVTLLPGPRDPVAAELEGTWTDPAGAPAPDGLDGRPLVIHTIEGADHCGWTSVTMLHLGWPLGTETDGGEFRQYLRDPHGVLRDVSAVPFDDAAQLPADAQPSGYRIGDWELWTAVDRDDAVYVVNGTTGAIERWGRARPPALCM